MRENVITFFFFLADKLFDQSLGIDFPPVDIWPSPDVMYKRPLLFPYVQDLVSINVALALRYAACAIWLSPDNLWPDLGCKIGTKLIVKEYW